MYSVYEITNQINGKKYIGITSRQINVRFQEHILRARSGVRGNRLYVAMRKYGWKNFTVRLIGQTLGENDVRELETKFIKESDSYNNGYNCNLGGHGFLHFPEDIKRKISEAQIGKVIPLESREKMSKAKIGDSACAKHFGEYTNKGNKNPRSKTYVVKFPDGHIEPIRGIRAFCRNHNLCLAHLYMRGHTKGFVLLTGSETIPKGSTLKRVEAAHILKKDEDIVRSAWQHAAVH